MSSLQSPGSLVSIVDDTVTVGSNSGTVPLFIVGTHANKTQPNSTSLASGTVSGSGNKVYAISSQRELINTFGNPVFYTKNGTPQNAYELNEYGLLAAYQYLGLANSAYVLRADLDYYELVPTTTSPYSSLTTKTFWLNSTTSNWGIFRNDGTGSSTSWSYQTPYVLDSNDNMAYVVKGTVGWPDISTTTLGDGVTYGSTTYAGITTNSYFTIVLGTGYVINVPYTTTDTLSDVYNSIKTAINANSNFNTVNVEYVSYDSITSNITCTANQNSDKLYAGTAWTLGTNYTNTGTSSNPTFDVAIPDAGITYNVTDGNEITTSNNVNGNNLIQTITIVPVGSSSKVTTITNTFSLNYSVDSTTNTNYLSSYTFVEQKQVTVEQSIYLQIVQNSITGGLTINGSADIMELLGFFEPTTSTKTQSFVVNANSTKGSKTLTLTGEYNLDSTASAVISQPGSGAAVTIKSTSTTTYTPNTALIANGGSGYAANDVLSIPNVGKVTVNTVDTNGKILTSTFSDAITSSTDFSGSNVASTGGKGTGATFVVGTTKTTTWKSTGITLSEAGTGYATNVEYTVGNNNDAITITSVDKNGAITGIAVALDSNSYNTDMAGTFNITNAINNATVILSGSYNSTSNISTLTLDSALVNNIAANTPVSITTTEIESVTPSTNVEGIVSKIPQPSYGLAISGQAGIYAVVSGKAAETTDSTVYDNIMIYEKIGGSYIPTGITNSTTGVEYTTATNYTWAIVGSDTWRNIKGNTFNFNSVLPTGTFEDGDVVIKTSSANNGTNMAMQYYDPSVGSWNSVACNLYENDTVATLNVGNSDYSVYAQYTTNTDGNVEAHYTIKLALNGNWNDMASETIQNNIVLYGSSSGETLIRYDFSSSEPEGNPEDGTMWFNNDLFADIMVGDGENWYGYRNYYPNTDANGVIISGSKPKQQSTGDALVDNDIWLDSSDTENYPVLYRYTSSTKSWSQIDNTNHTNGYGIIFEDARWTDDGSADGSQNASDLIVSNYLDPDAPDPRLYQKGTLLFNTRASTNNVKEWKANWFGGDYNGTDYLTKGYTIGQPTSTTNLGTYAAVSTAGTWVTKSGNNESGAPYMGRKAQRQIVVEALKEAVEENQDIRSELMYFTLITCPGYTELLSNMVNLNIDKNYMGFVVGDTPARLKSDTTSLTKYATNTNATTDGDDGIVTADSNLAVYYPWGLSTNVDGTSVVVPPSHMAIYTIANSDNISYPWFAPAGTTRGLVKNATSVGYVDSSGDFVSVTLNQGQNNILYPNKINAIMRYADSGLVIMGDKTRCSDSTSSLSRINAARLMSYVRYNLTINTRRFLFENNTSQTRASAKSLVDKFFTTLLNLGAIDDYITVVDSSNNTATTIAAHELWIDCAYVGVSTIDFIYVPVRIENEGTNLSSLYSGS